MEHAMTRGRLIIVAVCMVTLGVVLALVFFQGGDDEELARDGQEVAEPRQDPQARSFDDPDEDPGAAADEYVPKAPLNPDPSAQPSAPSGAMEAVTDGAPFPPEVRDHAKQMVLPSLSEAMERRDLKHLRELLQLLNEHRGEALVSEADLGAVEAAIACLEREPEAQQEAADFLRFGTRSALSESLAKACALR